MKEQVIDINALVQDDHNFNKGTEAGRELMEKSFKQLGAGRSVLIDKDGRIIAGNKSQKAAIAAGIKKVRIIETTGDELVAVKRTDISLDSKEGRELALADNLTTQVNLAWDEVELDKVAAQEGIDLPEWGIDPKSLGLQDPTETKEAQEDDFDEEKDKVETVCKKGDIWLLGQHRLMCGDSTLPEDVARLMDGEKADMTFTDPPYNIGYMGVKDKRSIKNDKMSNEDFVDFLTKSIMVTDTVYVCCSWQYAQLFREAMEKLGIAPKAMIVWNKVHAAQHLDKYYKQHEIIWYFGKFGGQKTLRGDIWEVPREPNTVHPTMKPIKLIAIALGDNPDKTIVYDGFGGSGSTLIACEQLGRKARVMELDEHYCDVIIARWEKLTGNKATKL